MTAHKVDAVVRKRQKPVLDLAFLKSFYQKETLLRQNWIWNVSICGNPHLKHSFENWLWILTGNCYTEIAALQYICQSTINFIWILRHGLHWAENKKNNCP